MNIVDWTRECGIRIKEKELEAICDGGLIFETPKLKRRYITDDESTNRIIVKHR